jgi:glutamate carboxypeptidase
MGNSYDFTQLASIININSYTKNKLGVDTNAEIFRKWMQALGFTTKVYKREEIGNHLLFSSAKREGKKLLLLGHLDTVFPPNSFEKFSEDEMWIYGPGVCDMKGGNFVALEALRNVKEIYHDISNIDFLLVSDEETGSDDSKALTKELAVGYDYCLVFEAAGKNGEVVVERKGVGTFFIDIKGKAAHAGNAYQSGINANLEAAHKLIALTALTDLQKETTVNVGKIEGGIGANTISPHARLVVELRYSDSAERDRVLDAFDRIVKHPFVKGSEATLSGGIQRDVMASNSAQEEFLKKLEEIVGVQIPTEKRGGVSDANIVASMGVVTLDGFGPFGDGDHTINERALKRSFYDRVEMVTKIFGAFLQGEI